MSLPDQKTKKTIYSATPREVVAFLWTIAKLRKSWLLFILVTVTIAPIATVYTPIALKQLVDSISTQQPSAEVLSGLLHILIVLVAVRLLSHLGWRGSGYISAWVQPRIEADLEARGLEGLMQRSHGFFSDQPAGSLVRRVTSLANAYSRLHGTFFWNLYPGLISAILIIGELLRTRPAAAVLVSVWIIVIGVGNYLISKWKRPADEERSRQQSAGSGLLSDIISNALTVKMFSHTHEEVQSFRERVDVRVKAEHIAWNRSEHGMAMSDITSAFLNAAVLYLALWGWERGQVTVGDFVLLQGFVVVLFEQLNYLGQSYRHMMEAVADASEMVGILKTPLEVKDVSKAKPLRVKKGSISFQGVSFSYAGSKVLKGMSLGVRPQEKIAFVGPSGAGKSTIVKLLLRFYDLETGKITIDGQDISKVTQDSLREAISLVPQDPVLFHRSLRENISYSHPDATIEEVIEASKKAHCHEFISRLPGGYDTLVGERGIKLSGGERQRVAIARAILKNAPILILDEATSALDSESEELIQDALHTLMHDKTVIVIAHRLSTIMGMDRIIVIEDGKMSDQGTHQELTKKVGKYRDLWHIQAGGFQS